MAKVIERTPTITISECIRELELINQNFFTLKQGVSHLISLIESEADIKDLKEVVKVFNLRHVLSNLSPKN